MSDFEFDLHTEKGRADYRASIAALTTDELEKLRTGLKSIHAGEGQIMSDYTRGQAGQKAAIIGDELSMRQRTASKPSTTSGKKFRAVPTVKSKLQAKPAPQAMTDEEYNAYRISVSSKSVEKLTQIFNELSAEEQKTGLTDQQRRVIAEKKKLVEASRTIRKHGGFQG